MFGFGLQSIEPIDMMMLLLGIRISFERTMLAAERFIQKSATEYRKHPVIYISLLRKASLN